ncbi:MAG: tripartite tricarboxylate transporter substrate binding protein [Pigmentiphaga sp.]|nr:tripartite tricarboxylate transporter substrate binding protein [Pigmentiphaga sp.]
MKPFAARIPSSAARRRARRTLCQLALAGAALAACGSVAASEAWPDRPVRLIAPFSPGAATDQVTRVLAQQLSDQLDTSFVVENRTGAAGRIAADAVVKAAADGYTALFGEPGGLVVAPAVYTATTTFDTERDLIPVAQVVSMPMVVVAHPSLGVSNLAELKAAATRGHLNYGTNGTGSVQHLTMETLADQLEVPLTHIPYRGGANAITDLVAGQIQLSLLTIPTVEAYIKSGQVVPLAVLDAERSPVLPHTATAREQGLEGLDVPIWCGFFLPAGTPPAIVERFSAELGKALQDPQIQDRLAKAGNTVTYRNHDAFQRWVADDVARWRAIVQNTGVQLD